MPKVAVETRGPAKMFKSNVTSLDPRNSVFMHKEPKTVTAVNNFNLEVMIGELFGILENNEAGKNALVKIVSTSAMLLPHSIKLMMMGWSVQTILPDILTLTVMCAVPLSLSYLACPVCLRTARKMETHHCSKPPSAGLARTTRRHREHGLGIRKNQVEKHKVPP